MPYIIVLAFLFVVAACSTKKNTAATRFYHSFTARYNTYFNGHEAYKTGVLSQETGHLDNFTETLPVFIVSNKATANIGKSNFDVTITKCEKAIKNHSIKRKPKMSNTRRRTAKQKRILAKKEYNPFLKNAWMLMGKAQFRKGEFIEAASTFSYITRLYAAEPDVLAESRAWLAICYSELDWFYDAEDVFTNKIKRDSLPHSALKDLDMAYADFYVRQEKFEEALPYLQRVAKHVKGARNKARIYFLIGQINNHLGNKEAAYKALSKVIRLSPPYEVTVNARVMQTEVVSKSKTKKMLKRLRSMARQSKNIKFLDQIYYAMGNIYLAAEDTLKAIESYEKGVTKGTRNGVEKGVLYLKLGDLYYSRNDFTSCKRCYSKAVSMIDKEREDYEDIEKKSKIIEELEPHTAAVHLQDSLQLLANMDEDRRNAIIDNIIEVEKENIRKERRKEAMKNRTANTGSRVTADDNASAGGATQSNTADGKESTWYFYNQQIVNQGKEAFRRQWGDRELADNWRRSNKEISETDLDSGDTEEDDGEEDENSEEAPSDSTQVTDSTANKVVSDSTKVEDGGEEVNEKLTREYYINQLPITEEQLAASNKTIMENLHAAGVIEKDKLENFPLAENTLTRLYTEYPTYEKMNEVLYELFLLYSRMGRADEAERYKAALMASYADDEHTKEITDPNFEFDAKFGKQVEDSLYRATYKAYREGDVNTIVANAAVSMTRYPDGENRPKFMFLDALAQLRLGRRDSMVSELNSLISAYPKDDITPIAQSIVKGLKEGRVPGTGMYDLGSLWDRRTAGAVAALDSLTRQQAMSAERNTDFTVVIAYPADSIDDNLLLYDLAHYNFTNFAVRNFEIQQAGNNGLGEFRVGGFLNFDEAHTYAQRLYNQPNMRPYFEHARLIVISNVNLGKLGVDYSISDYEKFYSVQFAPLKVKPGLQLDQQDIYISGDELPGDGDEQTQEQQDGADDNAGNDGEYYDYPEDVPDDGVEYYDEQGEDTGTPGEDTGNDGEYYDVPVPAPDENTPSPNDNPLAPDENTPVPDENTPAPDKETPAPDENTPAPDDGGDDNGEDDGWYDM